MPEFDEFDEDFDSEDQPQRNPLRDVIKQLKNENKQLRSAAAEAEMLKREKVFAKAGIDPDDPGARYFVKGYDGELTAEAVRQAAVEARLLSPDPSPQDAAEQQAWSRTNQVAAGAGTAIEGPSLLDRINNAGSEAELLAILAEHNQ